MNSQVKKPDIVLVMVPPWETKMPPIGIAYLVSYLNSHRFNSKIIDLNAYLYNKASRKNKRFWKIETLFQLLPRQVAKDLVGAFDKEVDSFVNQVLSIETKFIGFSVNYMSLFVAEKITEIIKQRDKKRIIIFGGPGCYWDFYKVKKGLVDIFVIGEGEKPLLNILISFYKKGIIEDIPGTLIHRDGKYIGEQRPDPMKKLDTIPFPTFEEFDLSLYSLYFRQNTRILPLLSSRGCPRRCSFCVDCTMCAPYRWKKPEDILEEIRFHIENNDCNNFSFNDLECNGNLRQLEAFCDLVIESKLKFNWGSYAVIRKDMEFKLLKKMEEAGCRNLCYGMDNASDKVLKKMNKPYTGQDAERLVRATHQSGIRTTINIIVGHPGEDNSCFKETLNFIKRNKKYIDEVTNVSTLFINPTGDIGLHPEKYGIYLPSDNWNHFYDNTGNNFKVRMKRLRKVLLTLYKLKIPHLIINHYPMEDGKFEGWKLRKVINKVDRAREDRNRGKSIIRDSLKLSWNNGWLKLYYQDKEVTEDVGLNSSFKIGKNWHDSSQGHWEIKMGRHRFIARIRWDNLPITQLWKIAIDGSGQLHWKVTTHLNTELDIGEWKVGLMTSERYKTWASGDEQGGFLEAEDIWQDITLKNPQNGCLELGSGDLGNLPDIIFDFSGNKLNVLGQVQNCPERMKARMLNARMMKDNLNFSGRIGISAHKLHTI